MTSIYDHPDVAEIIAFALREDLDPSGSGGRDDLTCRALVPAGAKLTGTVTAKSPGVVCGIELFARVFAALAQGANGSGHSGAVQTSAAAIDGARVAAGDVVLRMSGDAATMLQGERTALNLCQRMSGTATLTRRYVDAIAGTRAGIFDTRKTTPGMRVLQKHAVAAGGGRNHRMGLYDQVLIKENHIALFIAASTSGNAAAKTPAAGSPPAEAVRRARAALGGVVIEVEIEHLRDLEPVIAAGADIVLLDNMAPELLREAVRRRDATRAGARIARALPEVELEASGGITLATVRSFAETGVERISTGELTHSVAALDLSMRCAPAP